MDDRALTSIVTETITVATGELIKAANAPKGATGFEVVGSVNRWQLCPRLKAAFHFDNSEGEYIDLLDVLTERGVTTFAEIDGFEGTAENDYLYVGSTVPFRGVRINIKNANGEASVATWEYWDGADWSDTSDTDGTDSGGATLAIDNVVTWATPTDWEEVEVNGKTLFWVRLGVSADLDGDVQIAELVPLSVQTTGPVPAAITTGGPPPRYWFDPNVVGGIEAAGDNTEVLTVNWLITQRSRVLVAE